MLEAWKLKEMPPFHGVPSGNLQELISVFVDRDEEMNQAILTLDRGENVLVRGMMGIGKTAFIMAVLYYMQMQYEELGYDVLPIHIRQFSGCNRDELYKIILYALSKKLASRDKRAREILSAITGQEITESRKKGVNFGFEVTVPQIGGVKAGGELGKETSNALEIDMPEYYVDELLTIATKKKKCRRVIIAIDDLERAQNQHSIKAMLEASLDLIRDHRCSFILTGRTLTILEDVYASASGLNMFNATIPLKPLDEKQLRQIAIKTLNLVREESNEKSIAPFTKNVLDTILSKSFGIPRQFVLLCSRVLDMAVEVGASKLNSDVFEQAFSKLQDELAQKEVPPDIRRVLYLGLQQGGFSISRDANLDEIFKILGITTIRQFVDFADKLVIQELLQKFTDRQGEVYYRLAPATEKLAQSGKPEK